MDRIMENTRHCWNKTVCVGCTERTLVLSIFQHSFVPMFYYYFVHLCCVVPVSLHYILCLVAVCMKVQQNGRLVRFSRRTYCWCAFSWNICNQYGHFVRCMQSSSSQGYDGIHKSREDIIGLEEQWPKTKTD